MEASLPVLVTRLPDRKALARFVRAALRHEVAQVPLNEGPRKAQPHTLDLRVSGSSALSLLAEPAGAPQNGHFPLRLRPLHRAQAAELYALLEAESQEANAATQQSQPPAPDTGAVPQSAPIARAMSGSAPPPVTDAAAAEAARLQNLPDDPKRTAPSASWAPPPSSKGLSPRGASWKQPPAPGPSDVDDPRRTRPSASWAQTAAMASAPVAPPPAHGADAADASVSVSVEYEYESEDESEAGAVDRTQIGLAPPPPGVPPRVQMVFEPDASPALTREDPVFELSSSSANGAVGGDEPFFDDALANLPPVLLPEDGDPTAALSKHPVSSGGAVLLSRRDVELVDAGASPAVSAVSAEHDDDHEEDDDHGDDEDATLIRLPGAADPASASQAEAKKKSTGGGRKKKTTRRGKATENGPRKKKTTGHSAEFTPEEPPTSRRGKSSRDPVVGRKIADGKYFIESAIGAGAAGAVYKAMHRELRRTVALKVLHPHYQQDPHFMKGFRGEALAASQLDHPNVMRVLDFGQEPDGLVYIVMEFLSGRTLQNLLDEERRLPPDRAVEIMIQVCAALSVAHDNGIIHRDIKPDNIMLVPSRNDEGGTFELVKVCDFGIAALENPKAEDAELGVVEGVLAGTPEYMSPEQARAGEVDARADVYAAGICLYELVTGRPPFLGETAAEILIKQLEEVPKPPSQLVKGLDPLLEEIILRSIQKDPDKRQQSARELRVELKEMIDPGVQGADDDDDERSIVENVAGLDDPASGFPGFFLDLSSAVLRLGRFERGHPEASLAMKDLFRATKAALRGRRELTFARRDTPKSIGFVVMSGHAEIIDLKRLLGSQLFGSHGVPFIEALVKKGVAALTVREGIPDSELESLVELMLGSLAHEELRKELFARPLRHLSLLFVSDVVGRDRKLTWKVGLCAARLARDLRALSNVRGISLKKMREVREDLVTGVALLLTKGDEVRHFLFNADLVDDTVANLRGFSAFQCAPLIVERLHHETCADSAMALVSDFDGGKINRDVLTGYLRLFATRLLTERSIKADAAVTALYRRGIVTDADVPRDLQEQIRAETLAEGLMRDPSNFLRMLELVGDPDDYARELTTLEAAMAVLARRGEAGALLAATRVLAQHARNTSGRPGPRESHALRTMKSIIDKKRLVPIANALLSGPAAQREAAHQLLVMAGSAGAQALFIARETNADPAGRPLFVRTFRETGPAGWAILSAVLPRIEVQSDADITLIEDLLRSVPDRQDPVLAEAVGKFLAHPRLRPAALAAIVPLLGDRAKKPLIDALEFAEEPARFVAVQELRRLRAIDEQVTGIIERLLTIRGSASDELRAAAALALGDVAPPLRARALALLTKGVEAKRGLVSMLRGDGAAEEGVIVTEAMARALLVLDRAEGTRAIKARLQKADGPLRASLAALLQNPP